jgi:hypothetical protein
VNATPGTLRETEPSPEFSPRSNEFAKEPRGLQFCFGSILTNIRIFSAHNDDIANLLPVSPS